MVFALTSNARLLVSCAFACVLIACRTTATSETQPDTSHATNTAVKDAAAAARVVLTPTGRDPVEVAVEVVDTPESRQRGLMYRKQLDPNAGMLFIFDASEQHTFWMHNTLVPLDMLFITPDWHVLGIVENATPLTDSPRAVPGQSQYVLEVNAGFSRRHGLQAGTSVRYVAAGEQHGS